MSNPLRQLKFLPWLSLFQVAALAVFLAFVTDVLLAVAYFRIAALQSMLDAALAPPMGMLVALAIAAVVGALAVYLLERLQPNILINAGMLWALVLCVMVVLVIKSLLPLPAFLVGADDTALMGVVVGIFWKGHAYWRR